MTPHRPRAFSRSGVGFFIQTTRFEKLLGEAKASSRLALMDLRSECENSPKNDPALFLARNLDGSP